MKITRKQLRRIIREAISSPDQDKRMYDAIIDILPMRGDAISGRELVDAVNQELPDIDAELIYNFLDELLEDDVVIDKNITNLLPGIVSQAESVSSEYIRLEYMDQTYICLGKKYSPEIQFHLSRKMSEVLYKALQQYGARGQLISKAGIRLILKDMPFDDHVDNFFCKMRKKLNASVYKDSIVQTIGAEIYRDNSAKIPSLINTNLRERKFSTTELHDHDE